MQRKGRLSGILTHPGQLAWLQVLLFSTCALCHRAAAQGPLDGYMKGKGVLDIAPAVSFSTAKVFLGAGSRAYEEAFRATTLSVFAEYGITERFDLVATGAYLFTAARNGLQDGGLFVKYRPVYANYGKAGRLSIIGATGASFPLSNYEIVAAGALGQKAVAVPARLIVQYDSPAGIFINATGGYNWRLDRFKSADIEMVRQQRPDFEPRDPVPFATVLVKAGYAARHFYADAWIERQMTKGGNNYTPGLADLPQGYGVEYTQAGGVFYYSEHPKRGFFVSGGRIFSGRNTSKITRFTIGMVIKN